MGFHRESAAPLYQSIACGITEISFFLAQAAESEVTFGTLDGTDVRIGIIRTRWNEKHVTNLVDGCRKALKECNVKDENIFETTVPGSFELPLAARFLALSGTVDAIVTTGVLIKGEVSDQYTIFIYSWRVVHTLIANSDVVS